jgi:hypothetical protein
MHSWLLHFKQLEFRLITILFCVFLTAPFPGTAIAIGPPNEKHELILSSHETCKQCHNQKEAESFRGTTARSCSNSCLTCHKGHHEIKIWLKREPREPLPLRKDQKITCYTCHSLTQHRFDATPWKSESLFERFFNKQERYKTYYLRIKNNEGALCKNCH